MPFAYSAPWRFVRPDYATGTAPQPGAVSHKTIQNRHFWRAGMPPGRAARKHNCFNAPTAPPLRLREHLRRRVLARVFFRF